jgi:hypothetical protein
MIILPGLLVGGAPISSSVLPKTSRISIDVCPASWVSGNRCVREPVAAHRVIRQATSLASIASTVAAAPPATRIAARMRSSATRTSASAVTRSTLLGDA